mgnify:CR=1 FL=1
MKNVILTLANLTGYAVAAMALFALLPAADVSLPWWVALVAPAIVYTVVVTIQNDRGVEVARKLVGVGALNPNEQRSFTLSVEAVPAKGRGPGTRH